MASLCSLTSKQKILNSYRRKHKDDRPFLRSQKVILPIRGFKGNRILYGDSLEAVDEVTEEDDDDRVAEPVYSEPQFATVCADDSQISSSSDISSGYLSQEVNPHHRSLQPPTTTTSYCLSSPESGYLSSDEEFVQFHTGKSY